MRQIGSRLFLMAMSLFYISPMYWMVVTAMKSDQELASFPPTLWPQNLAWQKMYTLSLGLQFFKTMHGIQFNLLMAASCLVVLPVVMVFLFFQRFFIEGITLSSGR